MMHHDCTCTTTTSAEPCPLHFERVWKTDSFGYLVELVVSLPYEVRYDVVRQMRRERDHYLLAHSIQSSRRR